MSEHENAAAPVQGGSGGGDQFSPDGREASTSPAPSSAFRSAALDWQAKGWGALYLPARRKFYPPKGWTGGAAPYPSFADVHAWIGREAPDGANLALRMPAGIVGIDVDDHGGKGGGESFRARLAELGDLPNTYRLTSRDPQASRSGIYLYRVPDGSVTADMGDRLGHGIELIRPEYRYAVGPGSIHPEGRAYRLYGPDGAEVDGVVGPDDLPELPAAWAERLTKPARPNLEPGKAITGPHTQRQHNWVMGGVRAELEQLDQCTKLATPDGIGYTGPPWDETCFRVATNLVELANAGAGYTMAQAHADLTQHAPRDVGWTASHIADKWNHVRERTGTKVKAGVPTANDDALAGPLDGPCTICEPVATPAPPVIEEDGELIDPATGEVLSGKRERTGLQRLLDQLRLWVDGDLDQFTFACAVAVSAADGEGEPLWGQIVGPPSGAKTEAIRVTDSVANDRLDEVTVPGLLGWQKVGKTARMTGALARIGDDPTAGLLTIGDFSTLLGADKRSGSDTEKVFSALRRIYDGRYTRDVGTAPDQLRWEGRLTILSAVTHAIDEYSAHADALGARWVYFRVQDIARDKRRASRARHTETLPTRRRRAAELAAAAIRGARRRLPNVELSDALLDITDDAAEMAARGRGSVPRDGYGRRDIIGEPTVEEPYRLRQQLQALARALLALEMPDDAVGRFVTRCALDTVPRTRRKVLEVLAAGGEHSVRSIADQAGRIDRRVARRCLEDLRALDLAACPTVERLDGEDDESSLSVVRDWQLRSGYFGDLAARIIADQRAAGGGPR